MDKGREGAREEGVGEKEVEESREEERSGEPWALRMSGDPERESLAGAQRGTEGRRRRRRRRLKLHDYVRTLTFTQPPNICCFLLALHPYLPLSTNSTGTKTVRHTVRGQLDKRQTVKENMDSTRREVRRFGSAGTRENNIPHFCNKQTEFKR